MIRDKSNDFNELSQVSQVVPGKKRTWDRSLSWDFEELSQCPR